MFVMRMVNIFSVLMFVRITFVSLVTMAFKAG